MPLNEDPIKDSTPQQAPVITSHPQDVQVQEGQQEILKVIADGTMPLQYQWYHKSKTIPGADKSFYSIYPATKSKAGHYFCKVENQHGAEKSRSAMVTVTTSPIPLYSATDSGVAYPTNLDSKMVQIQDDTPLESKLPDLAQESTETESIETSFAKFVDDMFDILSQENFDRVKRKPLENLNVVGGISVTEDIEDKIDESENLSGLFNVLSGRCRPYWNWLNIRMLEKMAGDSSAAKHSIEKYKKNIYSKKVKDVMSEISNLEIPTNGYTEIKEKWNKGFNDLTIKDVVERWNEIEKVLKAEGTMLLKSINKGCLEVCWLLPNHLVEHISCSVTNNQQGRHDDDQSVTGTQDIKVNITRDDFDFLNAFMSLCSVFREELYNQPYDIVRGWCEQYCGEHWHDEHLNWNISSMNDLFNMLGKSSYNNPFNPGMWKFLANKSGNVHLNHCINNYEKEFSCKNIEDLDFIKNITVIGNGISQRESTTIVSILLENKVTIGQIWKFCTPKLTNDSILVLDASKPLLEFYCSAMDDETFLAKAKRENLVIDFQHIKILLTGSAAVGKTSFCHLLFRSKYSSEYKSTEIMEAKQGIVKNFSMVKQETKKEVLWLKLDAKNQMLHFKTLLKSRVFHQSNKEILLECASVTAQETSHHVSGSVDDQLTLQDDDDDAFTGVQKKILLGKSLPKALTVDKNEIIKFITVIDSGGQPAYIHMLPAINNSPTINFVVLDMTKHLDDQVMIQYKSKHNKSFTDYPLHYSNVDMIGLLMSLTTDSLEQPIKQTSTRTHLLIPNKSYIGFVGTHKDKLEKESFKEKIAELNDRLSNIVEERNCKFAVLSAENGILFPVDNTTAGDCDSEDPVVKTLRQKIEDLMDSNKNHNQLPITWMILELELQELHQNDGIKYVTFKEYKRIAIEKASMGLEEVEESLQHFDFLGILLHFKRVPGLCDYVIIDHQWLFDRLAMIMHLSPVDINFRDHHLKKQFKEKKLLAKSELCIVNWNDELRPEYFFNLLIYLKVIAPVMLNEVEYYYMPCVLSSTIQYHDKYIFLYSAPLLIQFSSGFLPRGFFCSLVVHLLQNLPNRWAHQLHNTEHFSNVIIIRLPDNSILRLHDKTSYLEVQIRHHTRDLCIFYHSKVFRILSQYFEDVCKKLNFNHDKLQYGFLCHDGKSNDDHIAVIKPFKFPLPPELECCRECPNLTQLGEFHKVWFEEIAREAEDDVRKPGDTSTCLSQSGILEQEPEMGNINKIVVPRIQVEWEDVAFALHYKIATVNTIKAMHNADPKRCCKELFKDWLSTDHGVSPKTWSTLLEKLQEIKDLAAATSEIKDELQKLSLTQ